MYLYLTADQIGAPSGGGKVTAHESAALRALAAERGEDCLVWGRAELLQGCPGWQGLTSAEPWIWPVILRKADIMP